MISTLKKNCQSIIFWVGFAMVAAWCLNTYSRIESDATEIKTKVVNIEQRLTRIEAKLDSMRDPYQGASK